MKRTSLFSLGALSALTLITTAFAGDINGKVIYGDDNRLNLYQVQDSRLAKMTESTVALFSANSVRVNPQSKDADLVLRKYGTAEGLCKDEPFYEEPQGAFCSGSLVAPDLIMTAGHCVKSESECKNTRFVFGFLVNKEGVYPSKVSASEVYECSKLIAREQNGNGADFALVQITRKSAHEPLVINNKSAIQNGTAVTVIGHPMGIPVKISGGAKVRSNANPGFFVANLDTYGGNSGSAVVNDITGEVEGILVRGATDMVYDGTKQCYKSNRCPNDGCRGEDVTKISALAKIIEDYKASH